MNSPNWKPAYADARTWNHGKFRSKERITHIVALVVEVRGVTAEEILASNRGSEAASSARVLAMAACAAVGVPLCHVARAFNRRWQTVYSAEQQASRRYRNSSEFRKQWDKITA